MHESSHILRQMRRPRLLVRAARIGAADYSRDRHLRRLVGPAPVAGTRAALDRLVAVEAPLDAARRSGDAAYSPARHVAVLSAIIAELAPTGAASTGPAAAMDAAHPTAAPDAALTTAAPDATPPTALAAAPAGAGPQARAQAKASGIDSRFCATYASSASPTAGSSVGGV
ncbi:hypothetical protein ROJ8625_01755 [Roseivivax jejudonensis]|uniref:Uncharacterized protein n=1 Tax=Roseivivax jejudonensis TaxID=1529041 RepID=A0A1X6Z2I6_9RHOB|nr:DUF6477 family protein [Roseivivax jejudonensis]SLN38300.1 hypothetical protein ROJ8625_01755 [Roseivivax jejudonensis]